MDDVLRMRYNFWKLILEDYVAGLAHLYGI